MELVISDCGEEIETDMLLHANGGETFPCQDEVDRLRKALEEARR